LKPAPFTYHAPQELDELLALLGDDTRDTRVIAGGQSLVPMMNFRLAAPERLVDLRRIERLGELRVLPDGLAVGAAVTQAAVLRSPAVAAQLPVLTEAIRHIGHPQIRSRGTVCGSLAHHDPTAELPAIAVALGARMAVMSAAGRREVPADDFFVSYYEVALEPGELLAEVVFPAPAATSGWSVRELARRRGDFALVGVVAGRERAADRAAETRLVAFGVGDRPRRLTAIESLVDGSVPDAELLDAVREAVAEALDPVSDIHASAELRRELAGELAAAALEEAWSRAR
jgi:carbon-monoxide dehydrogenase medium subunit